MSDTITPRLRIKAQPEVSVRAKAVPPPKVRLRIMPSLLPMQIELRNTGTMVQWRYLGQDWQDLIAIDDIDTTVSVGTVATLPPGSPATVVNVGTVKDMVLNFGIPEGVQGIQGEAATIAVGTVTTVNPADPAAVTNVGSPNDAVFDFDIPQGEAATVAVGTVTTLAPGAAATVVNVGTSAAAVLDFGIPRGAPGVVASIVAGANITVDSSDPAHPVVAAAGNVSGPASAVDNRVALFDGTTGKLIKDSGVVLGDSASRNVGTSAGTVAAGDDSRFETVPNDYVTNAKLANMAEATFKMRAAGAGTGDPIDGTASEAKTALALAKVDVGLGNVDNTSDATKNSATVTLTNKRVTPRVTTSGSSATPTINTDNCDVHRITGLATNITDMSTNLSGTPTDSQKLIIEITGTASRTIAWGTSFEASTVPLPTTTDGTNKLSVGLMWNSVTSKWRCMAVA